MLWLKSWFFAHNIKLITLYFIPKYLYLYIINIIDLTQRRCKDNRSVTEVHIYNSLSSEFILFMFLKTCWATEQRLLSADEHDSWKGSFLEQPQPGLQDNCQKLEYSQPSQQMAQFKLVHLQEKVAMVSKSSFPLGEVHADLRVAGAGWHVMCIVIQLCYVLFYRKAPLIQPGFLGQGMLVFLCLDKCKAVLYTDCTDISGINTRSSRLGLILPLTFIALWCLSCWGYVITLE